MNSSCPTASTFNVSGVATGAAAGAKGTDNCLSVVIQCFPSPRRCLILRSASGALIANAFNGECIEGMLGPQRSSAQTSPCAAANIKQQW